MTDVGRKTVRAAAWGFFAASAKRVVTLVGLTLLARLLTPRDFGMVGFAFVYLTFVEVAGNFGTGNALIYWPDRREDAAQTTFIINAAAGLFWCLFTVAVAPLIADFFNEPHGVAILRVLAVTTLIKFLGNTHDALAQKDLRFKERSVPELAFPLMKAAVALVMAWLGYGVWSLVWGQVAGITAWTIAVWAVVPWRPTWTIPSGLFGPILKYGRNIVAIQTMAAVMFDIDVVFVGRFLGVTTLGLYQMAARIPDSSVMVLVSMASRALFPAFAKVHAEGGDVRKAFLIAIRCMSSLTFPASMGLALLARPIIVVFFGAKWAEAAPILAVLAIYVMFRATDYEVNNVLKATGKTNVVVRLTALKAVLLAPAVVIGAMYSAQAVAGALAIVSFIGMIVATALAAPVIDVPLRTIAAAITRSGASTAAMSAAVIAWMFAASSLPPVVQLAGGILIGAVVYLVALRLLDPEIFDWARNIVLKKKGSDSETLMREA